MTGKNKEQFEKWLTDKHFDSCKKKGCIYPNVDSFYFSVPSMQWGVYLEYFDSIGIMITTDYDVNTKNPFYYWIAVDGVTRHDGEQDLTRQQAQQAALKKANELANEKL